MSERDRQNRELVALRVEDVEPQDGLNVVLTIDSSGVFDRRVTDRVVPWSAIAGLSTASVRNQNFCVLSLSRPRAEFVTHPLKRLLLATSAPFTGGGLYIGAQGLDATFEDIDYELSRQFKALHAPA